MARWIRPQSTVQSDTIVTIGASGNVIVQDNVRLETTGSFYAIRGEASNHQVMVFGTIQAHAGGIELGDEETVDHDNSVYVAQGGVVSTDFAPSILIQGYGSSIINDGTIGSSTASGGIFFSGSNEMTTSIVVNNGTIEGVNYAISSGGYANEKLNITNNGTISGQYLGIGGGSQNDLITNNGYVNGGIYLGSGDDVYRGQHGTVDGLLFGDGGDDRIYAGIGDQTIDGSYGIDIIRGGVGADTMNGGEGLFDMLEYRSSAAGIEIDLAAGTASGGDAQGDIFTGFEKVAGTEFADRITGDYHNNTLAGYSGDDVIAGGDGNDILRGGFGTDRLAGGRGADMLQGDGDTDFFQFNDRADSTVSKSGRDTILDFGAGDKIDLSGIDASTIVDGNQAFSFIGSGAFSGRNAEVRYEKKASDTYIYGDVNGDGKADFAIHLDDAVTLQSGDFVL